MRKKNQNSSVPNGMHSLAQRSKQEKRQKVENQQRAKAAAAQQNGATMQHVPEGNATYYGKKPMKQVPPPSVQKPEKPISQEALEQLKQQARRQPTDAAPLKPMEFYDHFFAEVPVQPDSKPVQSASALGQSSKTVMTPEMLQQLAALAQQAEATPKTVSLQMGEIAAEKSSEVQPNTRSVRDARSMPEMPTVIPQKTTQGLRLKSEEQPSRPVMTPEMLQQLAVLAQQAETTPKTVSLQMGEIAAEKSSEVQPNTRSVRDAQSMPEMPTAIPQKTTPGLQAKSEGQPSRSVMTPEMLQQLVSLAQQAEATPKTVSLQTEESMVESPVSALKAHGNREPRKMPEMPTAIPKKQASAEQTSEPELPIEDSPFITTAMLRQMAEAGDITTSPQQKQPSAKPQKQKVRFYGKPEPETIPPTEQRQSSRPAKPRDIALETAMSAEPAERFAEELPQVAEKRTKYLKNRQPKASVAELTGTTEKKSHLHSSNTSKAKKFFQELFLEDAPVDMEASEQPEREASVQIEAEEPVVNTADAALTFSKQQTVVSHAADEIPVPPKKRPVVSHAADEVPAPSKKRAVVSHAADEVPAPPKKRPVVSHAADEFPMQSKKRPVVSHAMDAETEQMERRSVVSERKNEEAETSQLESAAFYERLFHDFPSQPEDAVPTAEEVAQQQRKEAVIASVKGAVSAAEQNPSSKKQISKRVYLQRKAERLAMTIGISLIGSIILLLAAVLLIAPRSTISYEENRVLAEKPEFSLTAFLDGSYTAGLAEYYNDTVPFRSKLKKTISAMMQWTGIRDEEDTIFFGNVQQVKKKETIPTVTTAEAVSGTEETGSTMETTTVVTTTEDPNEEPPAEIGDGIILDHKRAICVYGGSFSTGQNYAESLNAYQEALGEDVQVYSMVAPTAVSYYLPEEYADYTASETENIDHINHYLQGVKPVDVYAALESHKAEAIYARTDHHWLPLGAYYAAEAFAEVADVPFAPLSDYDTATKTDYVGSMYTYTESAVLLNNPEEFTYYIPKNQYTTTYYSTSFTEPQEGDLLINIDDYAQSMYYLVFMGGDDKITHVETDCKNGRTLVMFKDSYGNALVPCFTQSFENIYVCDIRYFDLNAIDFCQEVGCTDLLFAMNTYSATGSNESYLESNRLQ